VQADEAAEEVPGDRVVRHDVALGCRFPTL
jgi:hypothetical protein